MVGVGIGLKKGARKAPTVLNSMFDERSVYNVSAQGRADGIRQTLNQGGWWLVAGGWLQLSVKFSINRQPPATSHQPPTTNLCLNKATFHQ
jgi:hypothetical protein